MKKETVIKVLKEKEKNPEKKFDKILNDLGIDKSYANFHYYRKKYNLDKNNYRGVNLNPEKKDKTKKQKKKKANNNKKSLLENALNDIQKKAKTDKNNIKLNNKDNQENKKAEKKKEQKLNFDFFRDHKTNLIIGGGILLMVIISTRLYFNKSSEEKKENNLSDKSYINKDIPIEKFKY